MLYRRAAAPAADVSPNTIICTATMVEPTGVPARIEINMPASEHTTAKTAAQTVTPKKLLNMRIAESAGKIIRAETSSDPTSFIASTIITAAATAINKL